ncbi:MAG: HlyD family efflux transporter periplasmic adaptor subunit [Dysgonamonadaceae bacterium]|jgi:HlyD family secretion protein|nr:HlyD family efflux transporter periplasmic adaptor subunit [Dysgonamonadaceae bacterium]
MQYYPQKAAMTRRRIAQYEEQYQNLLRQQRIGRQQLALAKKTFERDSLIHEQGGVSGKELDASRSTLLQSLMSQENMEASVNNMRIQIAQLKESLLDTEYQDTEKCNGLRSQLRSQFSQLKSELQAWELSYALVSPIEGKITFTRYWSENQNVLAGEEVFTVISTGKHEIIGKALLPIARSGKVRSGQRVNIHLENFPDTEYGMVKGVVKNISLVPARDGQSFSYTLEIALPDGLNTTYNKQLPYLPDMLGQADVITEDISLLERFFLPLKKLFSEFNGS